MKPDTTTDYDPIPEGLEFDESYMEAAFELYDAEKKTSKRRFIFWFWGIALGLTTGISLFLFVGYGKHVTSGSRQTLAGNAHKTSNIKSQNTQNPFLESKPSTVKAEKKTPSHSASQSIPKKKFVRSKNASSVTTNAFAIVTSPKAVAPSDHLLASQDALQQSTGKKSRSVTLMPINKSLLTFSSRQEKNDVQASTTYDSSDSTAQSKTGPRKLDPTKQHQFFLNTGVNTFFGISELQSEFHLRESFGISYENKFAKQFSFTAHAEMYALPSILYIQSLEGSSTNEQIVFTKTSLQFLTVSPKIDWTIRQKHHLALGAGCDILLKNIEERYDSRSYTGDLKPLNESYYQSFNRFNYFVSVGYGINLSNRFALYGTYHFGLSDIKKNSDGFNAIDRNSRFQLYLRMRVF